MEPSQSRRPRVGDTCPVCPGVIKSRGAATCSASCGSYLAHDRRGAEARRAHAAKMREGRRRLVIARLLEFFKQQSLPFVDRVPQRELVTAFAAVYRLGKTNGWQSCRASLLKQLRKSA